MTELRKLMQANRSQRDQDFRQKEKRAAFRVIGRAADAMMEGHKPSLKVLCRLAQSMDPIGIGARRDQLVPLTKYELVQKIDNGLYVVPTVVIRWATYAYCDDGCVPNRMRDYLRLRWVDDPLFIYDLESIVRGGAPSYGLTPAVLHDEHLLETRGDRALLSVDLRNFFRDFPHPAKEVKLSFRPKSVSDEIPL